MVFGSTAMARTSAGRSTAARPTRLPAASPDTVAPSVVSGFASDLASTTPVAAVSATRARPNTPRPSHTVWTRRSVAEAGKPRRTAPPSRPSSLTGTAALVAPEDAHGPARQCRGEHRLACGHLVVSVAVGLRQDVVGGVHHHHLAPGLGAVTLEQRAELRGAVLLHVLRRRHGEPGRQTLGALHRQSPLVAGGEHREGHLEHEQEQHGHADVGEEQPAGHVRCSGTSVSPGPSPTVCPGSSPTVSPGSSPTVCPGSSPTVFPRRSPTRRTVSIHSGCPSLRRSEATCTSRVLVGPYQWGSQTSSRIV